MKKSTAASKAPIKRPKTATGNAKPHKGVKPPKTGPNFRRDAGGKV